MEQTSIYEINYKNIKVKISDGSMVTGKINILTFPRLSDMLKYTNDKFVTVFSEEGEGSPRRVTIINKECVVWAEVED
jgi:hypothetical protein